MPGIEAVPLLADLQEGRHPYVAVGSSPSLLFSTLLSAYTFDRSLPRSLPDRLTHFRSLTAVRSNCERASRNLQERLRRVRRAAEILSATLSSSSPSGGFASDFCTFANFSARSKRDSIDGKARPVFECQERPSDGSTDDFTVIRSRTFRGFPLCAVAICKINRTQAQDVHARILKFSPEGFCPFFY